MKIYVFTNPHTYTMNSKNITGYRYTQSSENRLTSPFGQSMLDQFNEPTLKKPKLDIAKNGNITKFSKFSTKLSKRQDDNGESLWGDEFDIDEIIQVENEEFTALSQMTQSSTTQLVHQTFVKKEVGIQQEPYVDRNVASQIKNGPKKVPLRRIGSSQWPSSPSHQAVSSSYVRNAVVSGKGPANTSFLQSDLEKLKLENQKIKDELNKKAGEAIILRDKVNSSEKEKEKIRREFSSKMEALKAEAERNNSNLVKQIKSLRGQLDVKNMEIKTTERKIISSSVHRTQPDSTNRAGTSRSVPKDDSLDWEWSRTKRQGLPLKFLRESVMPELLELSQPESPLSESNQPGNPRLFSGAEGSNQKSRCPVAKRKLPPPHTSVSISSCATLLLCPALVDITSDFAEETVSKMLDICHDILLELVRQLEAASCSNSQFIERERELLMSGSRQLPLDKEYNLINHRELYREERGIAARRALGLMSLMVQSCDLAAKKILSSCSKKSTEVLDTVRNIVRQVEKQRRTLVLQGVLAGSVAVVRDLLLSSTTITTETQTMVVDILRWVVSARPGSLVVRNVLQTLLAALRFPLIISSLCHNSAEKTYKENPRHSIVQFTPDSCILQVLCGLVKATETPRKYQLTDLLTRWVLSLFCGGLPLPRWLTAVPTDKSCHCHSVVCKLCFSLLSEACFAHPTTCGEDLDLIEKVLARGVLLMNVFMNEDEHLLAIVDPKSLGCYEHFLHFMSESKITLDNNTQDFLGFLCNQEEVLKQQMTSTIEEQKSQFQPVLLNFMTGDKGRSSPNLLQALESS